MKLQALFEEAISIGMDADPRGKKTLQKKLQKVAERAKKLEADEKKFFDAETTWNPYGDSRIINGTGKEEVHALMVGIDIETPEILLADRLRERGEKIDAIFIHHPEGRALADLDKVMSLQVDILGTIGVPVNQSEAYMRPRMDQIWRSIHAGNLFRPERAAELLGFPAFCCHTPTDNLAYQFMEKNICAKEFDTLGDIIDALHTIPEFERYARMGNPAIIANGSKDGRPGKVVATEFTGGTNGPEEYLEAQAHAGIGTILSMHVTEKTLEAARKHHVNMIQCSHMASDSLGINLLLDQLKKKEKKLKVLEVSGFVRVER